jgi:uncharacterized protein (TIGR03067 family)
LLAVFLLSAGAGVHAALPRPHCQKGTDTAKTDQEKFQGTWLVVWQEQAGKAVPLIALQKMGAKIVVQGDRMQWQSKPGKEKTTPEDLNLTFRLDQSRSPTVIHGTVITEPHKEKKTAAIYEFLLNGEALQICWNLRDGGKPPAKFFAGKGSRHFRLDLVREDTQKSAEKAEPKRKPERTISLDGVRDKKRWKEVAEWLSDQTELPTVSPPRPPIGPIPSWPKEKRKLTIAKLWTSSTPS